MRRQRAAAGQVRRSLGGIADARERYTARVMSSVEAVRNASGGQVGRAREAARRARDPLAAFEKVLARETAGVMESIAELSANWAEHEGLWDELGPDDLETVVSAHESWTELREAVREAREADRVFLQSLRDFAALGHEVEEVSEGAIQRQQGILAAAGELESLANEYLVTIAAVEQRIR